MYCIPKHYRDEFIKRLKSGEISPDKLLDMSSKQRREFFSEFLGENNAQHVNYLLEKNLMLKDQQRGLVKWAKQVAGMNKERNRDLLSRIDKMEDVLTPETENEFLEDLASHKLGVTVTMDEASKITDLAKIATEAQQKMENSVRRKEGSSKATPEEREYGLSVVAFDNYLSALKQQAVKRSIPQIVKDSMKDPAGALRDAVSGVAASSKSIVGSLDNSFIGRQGVQLFHKAVATLPLGKTSSARTWLSTFTKSYQLLHGTFRGKPVMDELKAIIISDPDYKIFKRMRVAIGTIEEEYPASWPEKIPLLGKAFEASSNAYTGSSYWMRYRVAKTFLGIARKTGIDITDKQQLQSIGKLTNSLTSRGETGSKREEPGIVNNVFWSPKMIKGAVDVLTAHKFDKNMTPFAKKQAALNLLQIIAGTGMVLLTADLLGGDVEWDPRSANFGKIKTGNTRFSVNPFSTYVTLASRIIIPTMHNGEWGFWSKSSTTGKMTNLWGEWKKSKTTGISKKQWGQRTALDVFEQFLENKTSPLAGQLIGIMENQSRRDFNKPFNLTDAATGLTVPLSIQNIEEFHKDPESANIIVGMLLDAHGISTFTYSQYDNLSDDNILDTIAGNTYTGEYTDASGVSHKKDDPYVNFAEKYQDYKKEWEKRTGKTLTRGTIQARRNKLKRKK